MVERFLVRDEAEGEVEGGGRWRYLPIWGFSGAVSLSFSTEAALPRALLLTPALRSRCCSSVNVLTPSRRYLKSLKFLPFTFNGSCKVMISFRPNSSSLTKSLHIFAFTFNLSTVSQAYTLPVFPTATRCVLSVNTLKVTGSTISPSSFFRKCSVIRSVVLSGCPFTGLVPCSESHGRILSVSKIVPSAVHTGDLKGWSDRAQKLYGRRLKVLSGALDLARPEPALAEYASSDAHSLWVI